MPEPKEHQNRRGWIETVLRYIPGFRGYLEKEYRRESDALQRDWLVTQLQGAKRRLDAHARELTDAARLDDLGGIDRIRARLDRLTSRIQGAMQGYSGFFDFVQINEKELDQVYEYDVGLMQHVEQIVAAVEQLNADTPTLSQAHKAVFAKLEEFDHAWDKRENILKGLG